MPNYFADAAVQGTRGGRGKTTRRRSTKTVRGPEGAWVAQCKEELASRPAGWVAWQERASFKRWSGRWESKVFSLGRFDTEEAAAARAAGVPVGPAHTFRSPNGDSYAVRVWVEREAK